MVLYFIDMDILQYVSLEDGRALLAAQGWATLGNCREALNELDTVSEDARNTCCYLNSRLDICMRLDSWDEAKKVAEMAHQLYPTDPASWVAYATTLRKTEGLLRALGVLREAKRKFPNDSIISYNQACYLAQIGRLTEAMRAYRAFASSYERKHPSFFEFSKTDPDLIPIRKQILEFLKGF